MSVYTIHYRPQAFEDIASIPKNMQARILNAIEERLTKAPADYGVRLAQSLSGLWKLRVGDYRVVFEIQNRQVILWAILHRKNVYPKVSKRWA